MADELKVKLAQNSVRAPDFKVLYTNAVTVGFTPWDFNFMVGHVVDSTINETALIVMAPAHAKALLRIWTTNIQQYEKMFGEIPDNTVAIAKAQAAMADTPGKVLNSNK